VEYRPESRYSVAGVGSLKIDGVREEDGGLYTCRSINAEDSLDTDVTLIVQGSSNTSH